MLKEDFDEFHKQVLNMPRESFSNFNLGTLRSIAEYLELINTDIDSEGCSLKDLYIKIHFALKENNIINPNERFENLFDISLEDIEDIEINYEKNGRLFRHWMELAKLLELLVHSNFGSGKRGNLIVSSFNTELHKSEQKLFFVLLRDKVLSINIKNNPHIQDLKSVYYYKDLYFRPAVAILVYLLLLNRPATKFELSIFFGRPDRTLEFEDKIIENAYNIGKNFSLDLKQQELSFFRMKGWISESHKTVYYRTSQQSYFKFNSFFILMEAVGLIEIKEDLIYPTSYSIELAKNYSYLEYIQLQEIEKQIEDENDEIQSTLIENRTELIIRLLSKDKNFREIANKKSASKGKIIKKTTKTFRQRDLILPIIAKIEANFICNGCSNKTFIGKDGYNYVETHHILEFNSLEDGPDVLENMVVLCPNCHALVHNATNDYIKNFYSDLRQRNNITITQFEKLLEDKLISKKHIKLLLKKGIISNEEYKVLIR